ncbi:FtsJ methyltransferase domain-containing protein 2 [Actinomortierella ambigua]|uniref:Cap-specific mRNA (nucleoside-2'-O-)-methyltransferase 1 n=1 Tax=Actinomortierella ambigua TaxID=1343610 RepID=A0A9P6QKH2_9FUNG|nr:FtsJ methyltransferase domain-containing protein 2 [Actinomortierella ambigua]
MADPYNDNDPAYEATPLQSPTPVPTTRTCPRQGGGKGYQANVDYAQQFQQRRYPPLPQHNNPYNSHPPGYGPPPPHQQQHYDSRGGYGQHQYQRGRQQQYPGPHSTPMLPPEQFLDQHLEIFQAPSYTIPESAFMVDVGEQEEINYDQFCTRDTYETLIGKKSRLSSIEKDVFAVARKRCNPYEMVGNSIFMNRAAVKLASMDSQLALTANKEPARPWAESPYASTPTPHSQPEVFRFVDVCSGPGGFSEYLLWRKHTWGEQAHGWATTIKGDLDFTLDQFCPEANVQQSLTTHYGADGTGDLLKRANVEAFAEAVDRDTAGLGVGLVTADGGISMEDDQGAQELRMRHLLLNQILTMFMTLQKGGDFVIKMFDIFTPVTAELVWILSRHFEKICILKPLTSRPMNSERYVLCRRLLERRPARTIAHLFRAHQAFEDSAAAAIAGASTAVDRQVKHILSPSTVTDDQSFMGYLRHHNLETAKRQLEALDICLRFANDRVEPAFDQRAIMRLCLQQWRIPPHPSSSSTSSHGGGYHGQDHPSQSYNNQHHRQHPQQQQQQQQQHRHQGSYQSQRPRPSHPQSGQYGQQGPPPGFHPYQHPLPNRPPPPGGRGAGGGSPGVGSSGSQSSGLLDSILSSIQKPTGRR